MVCLSYGPSPNTFCLNQCTVDLVGLASYERDEQPGEGPGRRAESDQLYSCVLASVLC